MNASFQYDAFLSHSAKDKAVAERLRKDGLKVWFDEWVLKAGDSIPKIEEGLEHSRVLVLCMSTNAFAADWAQLDAGTFRFRDPLNKEHRFIPLRLGAAASKASWRNSFTSTGSGRNASRNMRSSSKPVARQRNWRWRKHRPLPRTLRRSSSNST